MEHEEEGDDHDHDHDHDEEHGAALHIIGVSSGSTSFTLQLMHCLLYTSPSPRDQRGSRMPSSA